MPLAKSEQDNIGPANPRPVSAGEFQTGYHQDTAERLGSIDPRYSGMTKNVAYKKWSPQIEPDVALDLDRASPDLRVHMAIMSAYDRRAGMTIATNG